MNILGLEPSTIEKIINSLEESKEKEWIKLQYKEQKEGGAWKSRIREQGYSI